MPRRLQALGALWDCRGAGCGRLMTLRSSCVTTQGRQTCRDAAVEQWMLADTPWLMRAQHMLIAR